MVSGIRCLKDYGRDDQVSMEAVKVSCIINNKDDWDGDLIQALFHPIVVAKILKIRLGSIHQQDRCVWAKEKEGRFSVRSAKNFFRNFQSDIRGECSSLNSLNPLWKHLWKLKIPPMTIFLVIKNFFARKLINSSKCNFCNHPMEDLSHALIFCPSMKQWWKYYLNLLNIFDHANKSFYDMAGLLCRMEMGRI